MKQKLTILMLAILAPFCLFHQQIQAESFSTTSTMKVYYQNQELTDVRSFDNVAIGSTLRLHFEVETKATISATIGIQSIQGLSYQPYSDQVLKANGQAMTKSEYQSFLTSIGTNVTLSTSKTMFDLLVTYQGGVQGKLQIDLSFNHQTQSYVQGFEKQTTKSKEEYFIVQFYLENKLISKQSIPKGKLPFLPIVEKEGFTLIGFNTNEQGTGAFYNLIGTTSNQTYYVILKKKSFQVEYYVEGSLYALRAVDYGENAEMLPLNNLQNLKFIRWEGNTQNIKSPQKLYAILEIEQGDQYSFLSNKDKTIYTGVLIPIPLHQVRGISPSGSNGYYYDQHGEAVSKIPIHYIERFLMEHDSFLLYFLIWLLCIVGILIWRKRKKDQQSKLRA